MKIRSGFVSNSSSSSFLIYGTILELKQQIKIIKKSKPELSTNDDIDVYAYIDDAIYNFTKGTDLSVYYQCDGEFVYIGTSLSKIKDEETGKQFKDRIKQKIVEILEEDIKCSIIEGE